MSKRTDPFETLERFFEDMSEQFEDAADAWRRGEPVERWESTIGSRSLALDLVDREETFVVVVDVPGFDIEDIDIEVRDDEVLHIAAEREREVAAEDEEFVREERTHRAVSRTIALPGKVVTEEVTASVEDGVLEVVLPKADPRREPGSRSPTSDRYRVDPARGRTVLRSPRAPPGAIPAP